MEEGLAVSTIHPRLAETISALAPVSISFTPADPSVLPEQTMAWYAVELPGGTESGSRPDESQPLPGAERLLLALTAAVLENEGRCDLDAEVMYEDRHRAGAEAGLLRRLEPGKRMRLTELLTLSIILADSVALDLVLEHIAELGVDLPAEFSRVCALASDGGLSYSGLRKSDGRERHTIEGSPRGLARMLESLLADAYPQAGLRSELALPRALAAELVGVFSSVYDEGDGLAALLPGYGPFSTQAPHLLVDAGEPARRGGGTFVDVCAPILDGIPLYIVSAVCPGVPDEVSGLPGGYAARKRMAVLGRSLWNLRVQER